MSSDCVRTFLLMNSRSKKREVRLLALLNRIQFDCSPSLLLLVCGGVTFSKRLSSIDRQELNWLVKPGLLSSLPFLVHLVFSGSGVVLVKLSTRFRFLLISLSRSSVSSTILVSFWGILSVSKVRRRFLKRVLKFLLSRDLSWFSSSNWLWITCFSKSDWESFGSFFLIGWFNWSSIPNLEFLEDDEEKKITRKISRALKISSKSFWIKFLNLCVVVLSLKNRFSDMCVWSDSSCLLVRSTSVFWFLNFRNFSRNWIADWWLGSAKKNWPWA